MRPSFNPLNSIMSGIRLSLSLSWCCCGNWWALDSCRTTLPWQRSQPTPMHMCVNVCVCACAVFCFFLLYCCMSGVRYAVISQGLWEQGAGTILMPTLTSPRLRIKVFFFSFLSPHKTCGKPQIYQICQNKSWGCCVATALIVSLVAARTPWPDWPRCSVGGQVVFGLNRSWLIVHTVDFRFFFLDLSVSLCLQWNPRFLTVFVWRSLFLSAVPTVCHHGFKCELMIFNVQQRWWLECGDL